MRRFFTSTAFALLWSLWPGTSNAKSPQSTDSIPLTASQEAKARALEQKLIAPCCFKGLLSDHQSPVATQMKRDIRDWTAKGVTDEEILSRFKGRYGQAVLADPPQDTVSGLILYGIPFGSVALVILIVTTVLTTRRARGRLSTKSPSVRAAIGSEEYPAPRSIPPELEKRTDDLIDAWLKKQRLATDSLIERKKGVC